MNPEKLKRDARKVHETLRTTEDGQMITTKGCRIYIPARFGEQGLAFLSGDTQIVGIFAITVDDTYFGVSLATAMMRIEPSNTNTIKIDDEDYIEFTFDPGSVVTPNVNLVKDDTLPYRIYNELIAKGRAPWFMGYEDLGRIYENSKYHSGVKVGANHAVPELMVAAICRDAKVKTRYYRHVVESYQDLITNPPVVIPLRDVSLGATNTSAKILGSYYSEGLTSALVNPSDRTEPIERLLRM